MNDSYFGKHLSMSEWALRAGLPNSGAIVREDGDKRARLGVLSQEVGLPVVRSFEFAVSQIVNQSDAFMAFMHACGQTLYAARGYSSEVGKPILRKRARTVEDLRSWIVSESATIDSYTFSFEQHIDAELATIFVIGQERIAGEAITGGILALNSGSFNTDDVHAFEVESDRWFFPSPPPMSLERFLRQALAYVRVDDREVRESLEEKLGATFAGSYLCGYFEAISSTTSGLIFIDYNRVMVDSVPPLPRRVGVGADDLVIVEGRVGCAGIAAGRARTVGVGESGGVTLEEGEILVCHFTDPGFLPLMMSAAAVVTDVGGVLSHAAIVCRELRKPCVVGTNYATERIATGDWIEVNADRGFVRSIAPKDHLTKA